MKAITCDMILTNASTRADGSLGLRFSTPELKPEEKTAFFELINQNLKVLVEPWDTPPDEMLKIAEKLDGKTPSQRLRAVLFVLYNQRGGMNDFEEFYRRNMEKLIDYVKGKLEPE